MEPGQQVTLRGPYGNGFPVDTAFRGKDLVFIAGGIGLAPLRSVIRYVRANRSWYGQVDIVYGARSRDDLVDYPEIVEQWCQEEGLRVHLTIDREQPGWDGHVGFVPCYVRELGFDTGKTAVVCGPPVMIQFTLEALQAMGFGVMKGKSHRGNGFASAGGNCQGKEAGIEQVPLLLALS